MCLAIPGKVERIVRSEDPVMRTAKVSFSGIVKQVNLACVPEASVGDYVLVHVGFAISRINEAEAKRVFEALKEIDLLEELETD